MVPERLRKKKKIKATIPAGIEDNMKMRVPGEGNKGINGGPSGDLYIIIRVKDHKDFGRRGSTLVYYAGISIYKALLGGDIFVPKLGGGEVKVKIPEGTQNDTTFRVKKEGLPEINSRRRGDLYIHVKVEVPTNLSKKEKDLLKKASQESSTDHTKASSLYQELKRQYNSGF